MKKQEVTFPVTVKKQQQPMFPVTVKKQEVTFPVNIKKQEVTFPVNIKKQEIVPKKQEQVIVPKKQEVVIVPKKQEQVVDYKESILYKYIRKCINIKRNMMQNYYGNIFGIGAKLNDLKADEIEVDRNKIWDVQKFIKKQMTLLTPLIKNLLYYKQEYSSQFINNDNIELLRLSHQLVSDVFPIDIKTYNEIIQFFQDNKIEGIISMNFKVGFLEFLFNISGFDVQRSSIEKMEDDNGIIPSAKDFENNFSTIRRLFVKRENKEQIKKRKGLKEIRGKQKLLQQEGRGNIKLRVLSNDSKNKYIQKLKLQFYKLPKIQLTNKQQQLFQKFNSSAYTKMQGVIVDNKYLNQQYYQYDDPMTKICNPKHINKYDQDIRNKNYEGKLMQLAYSVYTENVQLIYILLTEFTIANLDVDLFVKSYTYLLSQKPTLRTMMIININDYNCLDIFMKLPIQKIKKKIVTKYSFGNDMQIILFF